MSKIRGTRGDDYIMAWSHEGKPDRFLGLGGDDRFIFHDLAERDVFIGGPGDDTLLDVSFYLPMRPVRVERGLTFDGGREWDAIHIEVTVDRHDQTARLGQLYGKLTSVEERRVDVILDAQGRRPLDDFRLFGSTAADSLSIRLDDGTAADDVVIDMGKGHDIVTIEDGIGDLRIALGRGDDRYVGYNTWSDISASDRTFVSGGPGRDDFELGASVERIFGGDGKDAIRLGLNQIGLKTDVVKGGRGADDFVLRRWDMTREIAEIEDFRSGTDKVVIDGYVLFPRGTSVDLALEFDVPDAFSTGLSYIRASGSLFWRDDLVLQFDPGTKIVEGDVIGTYDYDLLI